MSKKRISAKTQRHIKSAMMTRVNNRYDIVDNPYNANGGKKRRMYRVENQPEDEILTDYQRLAVINLARDMVRNNPQARGTTKTMRVNIVGDYGKLQFKTQGEWYKQVQSWFNSVWAKKADFLDNSTFRECLQLIVYAIANEGDFVVVFDNGIVSGKKPHGTGKLLFFEADQICNLNESDFADFAKLGFTQKGGIIRDRFGRHCGIICTGKNGALEVSKSEAIVLACDPDSDTLPPWLHVRRKFRLKQGRGIADSVTALESIIDGHEMLGYERQSAKRAAAQYVAVIEPPDTDLNAVQDLGGFEDEDETATGESGSADGDEDAEIEEEFHAPALEEVTGGLTDYFPNNTDIKYPPQDRPNSNLAPFLDYVTDLAGLSHGLMHAYSRGKADSSYTAFRGDMVMTWMSFKDFQQFLEDNFSDWLAVVVIEWAILTGKVTQPPADIGESWKYKVTWQYPKMPAVDEQKETTANAQKLKTGLITFADLLGPEWREKFDELSDEIAYAKEKGIPLAVLETASGQTVGNNSNEENTNVEK